MKLSTPATFATMLVLAAVSPTSSTTHTLRGSYESAVSELKEHRELTAGDVRSLGKKKKESDAPTTDDDQKYKNDSNERQGQQAGKKKKDNEQKMQNTEKDNVVNSRVDTSVGSIQGSLNGGGFINGNNGIVGRGTKMGYNEFLKTYKKAVDPQTGANYVTWPPNAMITCGATMECKASCCCVRHGMYQYCIEDDTAASSMCMPLSP